MRRGGRFRVEQRPLNESHSRGAVRVLMITDTKTGCKIKVSEFGDHQYDTSEAALSLNFGEYFYEPLEERRKQEDERRYRVRRRRG